jgi:hypothetical protein
MTPSTDMPTREGSRNGQGGCCVAETWPNGFVKIVWPMAVAIDIWKERRHVHTCRSWPHVVVRKI